MPAAVPIVIGAVAAAAAEAALAGIAIGTVLGGTITLGSATILGTSLAAIGGGVVGGLASMAASALLSPKAKAQSSGSSNVVYPYVDAGVKTNARNTVGFREVVYGRTRKAGDLIFEKTTSSGENNLGDILAGRDVYLHQLIVFASHECEEFVTLYLDDEILQLDGDGWVQNAKYTDNDDDQAAKGATSFAGTGTADTATGSGTSATVYIDTAFATASGVLGAGDLIKVAGLSDAAYNGQFLIDSIATHAAGAATRINYTTDSTIVSTGISQASLTVDINPIGYRSSTAFVYDSTNHDLNSGDRVYIFDADVDLYNEDKTTVTDTTSNRTFSYTLSSTPTQVATSASFQRRNGEDSALVNIQTFLGGAGQDIGSNADVSDLIRGFFQSTDLGTGLCCAYVRFYNAVAFTTSPQLTVELKGAKLYDPRDGSLAYSNNAALVYMDYLHRKIGENEDVPIGVGLQYDTATNTSNDIDIDNFADAANTCDEQILLSNGSYTERYTINGVVSLGEQPIDVLGLMLAAMQGQQGDFDWKIKLFPAAYTPAVHQIDETWLRDSFSVQIVNDKETLVNTVRCIFNDIDQLYYPDDMPKYQDATFLAADGGEELSEDLQLNFVTESERAQRLGKLYLQIRRKRLTVSLPLNMKGAVIAPNDTVSFSYSRWNWQNRIFKVQQVSEGLLNEGISIIMRAESSDVYDWSASEAQ
jgi:hypothetical protein